MLNERIVELIQADVDGALEEAGSAELQAVLEQSAEARAFRDEMLQVAKILHEIPDLEPPAGLNRRILDSIELPARRQLPIWLKNWFQPASYGLAVAAGMLFAVGMLKLVPFSDDYDMTSLVGTMVKRGDVLPSQASGQLAVDLDSVEGSILLKDLDGALALQFDLFSAESVEIDVDLTHSGLVFGGFAHNTPELEVFEVSGGNLRVLNEGKQRFVVFLKPSNSTGAGARDVGVTIIQDNLRIFEGSIAFGG